MASDVHVLTGRFVTEVGIRQAWPFVTLCDNRPTPANEVRLYIDTVFEVAPGLPVCGDDELERLTALAGLNNRTVTEARISRANELILSFDNGECVLTISGEDANFTTHDIWWLASQ